MYKQIVVVLVLLVVGVMLFAKIDTSRSGQPAGDRNFSLPLPSLSFPFLRFPSSEESAAKEAAWQTFQNYLIFAQAHDLTGIRSLSHQISDTCLSAEAGNNPDKEAECFALMDSVYAIGSSLEFADFKNIQEDQRQIILYTDGPTVVILYFTRDAAGAPKMLGMRFCLEDETSKAKCVETDPVKRDLNGNGWWDSVESLFYQ